MAVRPLIHLVLIAALAFPACRMSSPISSYGASPSPAATTEPPEESPPATNFDALDATAAPESTGAAGARPRPGRTSSRPRLGSKTIVFKDLLGESSRKRAGEQTFYSFQKCRSRGAAPEAFEFFVSSDQGRAVSILRQTCRGQMQADAAEAEARAYFPLDAKDEQRTVRNMENEEARVFSSPALAEALPADWFTDCNDELVAPGTFTLLLVPDGWTLDTGTCPT